MDNQLAKSEQLIFTLERQNKQGEALVQVLRDVSNIADRMQNQESRINDRFEEIEALCEKTSKQVTINYEEQQEIRSLIQRKASQFAKTHLSDTVYNDLLFKAWMGLFNRRMHAKLKIHMNVVRYTSIRRTECAEAISFLDQLTYKDFGVKELEPTLSILKIMELHK